jgi:hypothetical protein
MPKDRIPTAGKVRAWLASLSLALAISAAAASTATALPATFWGMDSQATPTAEQFQRLRRGGVGSFRISLPWSGVQPVKGGALNWAGIDAVVGGAAAAGFNVLPFVYDAPSWVMSRMVVDGRNHVRAPRSLPVKTAAQRAAWAAFLEQAVARYGPNGTFWAENPTIPPHPIRTWQIWNEENFKYFVALPNPADYGELVKISYAAIKSADPRAQIVLGGMFAKPKGARFLRPGKRRTVANPTSHNYYASYFLEQMYNTTPGIRAKFSGVALHPYSYYFQQLPEEIEELRAVMAKNHDAGKGLWITELGWSSQPPTHSNLFAKGVAGQKKQLEGAFRILRNKQRQWRIQRVYWFSVDDQAGSCNFCDGSGLFREGFVPKPAWYAYARFAGGTP